MHKDSCVGPRPVGGKKHRSFCFLLWRRVEALSADINPALLKCETRGLPYGVDSRMFSGSESCGVSPLQAAAPRNLDNSFEKGSR